MYLESEVSLLVLVMPRLVTSANPETLPYRHSDAPFKKKVILTNIESLNQHLFDNENSHAICLE